MLHGATIMYILYTINRFTCAHLNLYFQKMWKWSKNVH